MTEQTFGILILVFRLLYLSGCVWAVTYITGQDIFSAICLVGGIWILMSWYFKWLEKVEK